jgi:glycosyltransferase involved in cell wall biosynthesis
MTKARNKKESGLRVLVIEPYYGGSHRSFISNLTRLPFEFEVMSLPARKWKWRMRLSAPFFPRKLRETGKRFDRIICSTFVDVAAFRAFAPEWTRDVPHLTYFHENQFAYPVQVKDERDFHFALTNMTTALSSDSLAFNSAYNLSSFLDGIKDILKFSSDMRLDNPCKKILAKSIVLPPGIDFRAIDAEETTVSDGPPVIVWNHRWEWEHDKNPEQFFKALYDLDREGIDFRLIVLGKSYERKPAVFDEARKRLSKRILHFGFARARRDYTRWLRQGDIAVSTAGHEFFGIAVVEAVRAGARPLLPKRLSYPELFPDEFLYDEEDFAHRLKDEVLRGERLTPEMSERLTVPYSWDSLSAAYRSWIQNARVL